MLNLIHISDLHFHRAGNDKIIRKLNHLRNKMDDDDYLCITGDVTDDGIEQQYQNAQNALIQFHNKIIVPGNHDFGILGNFYSSKSVKLFNAYLSSKEVSFRTKFPSIIKVEGIRIICLDSNNRTENPFDFASGEIGWLTRFYLDFILAEKEPTVILMHHHPFIIDKTMYLRDREDFMRLLYNRVNLLLFGHNHIQEEYDIKGIGQCYQAGAFDNEQYINKFSITSEKIVVNKIDLKE